MRSTMLRAGVAFALALMTFAGPFGAAANAQSAGAPAASAQGTLGGVVVDDAARPIAGATVSVTGPGVNLTAITDGSGTFSVAVGPGLYTVVVNRGGFRTGESDDVAVTAGGRTSLRLQLTQANLNSLQSIGRVSTSARRPLNTNTSAVTSVNAEIESERVLPRLNELVAELPGVTLQRGNLSPNADFVIRGGLREARTFIDGHPVASGNFGAYNTGYTDPFAFGNIEITKGPGFFGPNGAETVFGTANLVTPGFLSRRAFDLQAGVDSSAGSFGNLLYRDSTANQKIQWVIGKSYIGTRDAGDGSAYPRLNGNVNPTSPVVAGQQPTFINNQTLDFVADASNRQYSAHELFKVRGQFSDTTSVSAEFLGLHGGLSNQGGNYTGLIPNYVVPRCVPTNSAAGCDAGAAYNAPNFNYLIGSPTPALVGTAIGAVADNEQFYALEFRTAFKNDTILIRPYEAQIQRLILGGNQAQIAGYAGIDTNNPYSKANSWYIVQNPATQCTGTYSSATPAVVTNGKVVTPAVPATGSCVFANTATYSNFNSGPVTGAAAAAACPVIANPATFNLATACFIPGMVLNNSQQLAFGRNINQPEVDTLHGITFQYTHPVGDNVFTVAYDYNSDNSTFTSGDVSPYTVPITYGNTNLGQIPTLYRKNTFSVGAQLHLTPTISATLGGYFLNFTNSTYAVNPSQVAAVIAQLATNANAFNNAPLNLLPFQQTYSHFDPRVGLTWRPGPADIIRASVGSAITVPYPGFAGQLPGLRAPSGQTQPQASNFIITLANPNLQPQTTVAYNLGFDHRLGDGGVLTADAFRNTIFNAFASSTIPSTTVTSPDPRYGVYQSVNINAGSIANYGVELSVDKIPTLGWGYRFSTTLQRNYYYNLDPSLFTFALNSLVPYKQIDTTPKIPFSKVYAELRYAGLKRTLVTLGADYTGPNNQPNFPSGFTVLNSTVRFPIGGLTFQAAADNLSNFGTGVQGIGGLYDAGNYTLTYGKTGSTTTTTGGVYGQNGFPNNLLRIPPRTIRFSLEKRF